MRQKNSFTKKPELAVPIPEEIGTNVPKIEINNPKEAKEYLQHILADYKQGLIEKEMYDRQYKYGCKMLDYWSKAAEIRAIKDLEARLLKLEIQGQ